MAVPRVFLATLSITCSEKKGNGGEVRSRGAVQGVGVEGGGLTEETVVMAGRAFD